jgi:integrase
VRPIITFAYITGWRIRSEVLSLQWRQVDFVSGDVRLDPGSTKNREGRVFPFTAELRTLLTAQLAEHETLKQAGKIVPWVFQRDGERIAGFRRAWITACKAAGCPGRIPHDLRRTAVRNLVRAGIPERVAMQMTGHKTRSVFERYNIVSDGDLRDAAKRLDAMLPVGIGAASKS